MQFTAMRLLKRKLKSADEKKNILGLSEALFLAVLSAGGYFANYAYQMGMCFYFGIPYDMIRISLETTILTTIVISYIFIFASALILPNIHDIINAPKEQRYLHACSMIAVIIVGFISITIYAFGSPLTRYQWESSYYTGMAFGFITFIILFLYFLRRPPIILWPANKIRNFYNSSKTLLGPQIVNAMLFFIVIAMVSWLLGYANSRNRIIWPIMPSDKLALVVRYNDWLVFKRYSDEPFSLERGFRILTVDSIKEKEMRIKYLEDKVTKFFTEKEGKSKSISPATK